MILNEYFDRIVILTLDPRGDRACATLSELTEKNLAKSAELMRGYRGEEMLPPEWFKASAAAWGCLKSHIRVLEDAIRDGVQRLLVLEDDCIWLPEASRLAQRFLMEVPADWGQIYFGGQMRARFPSEPLRGKLACVRARAVHRAHAYAVSRATLPLMLQHVQRAPDYIRAAARAKGKKRHFDHQLEVAHRRGDWPVYAPSYWLAGQRENYSLVTAKHEHERWWQLLPRDAPSGAPLILADTLPTPSQVRKLHFGYNLSSSNPTIDLDVQWAKGRAELVRTMKIIAHEALRHRRLPAIHPWPEKRALLEKHWAGDLFKLSDSPDLDALSGLPAYPHPWVNPTSAPLTTS